MPRFFLIGFLVALPLVAFTACGGGDGAEPTPTATGEPVNDQTPLPSPAGTPVGPLTDAEYLAVICSGLSEYSAAIIREQTEEGLSAVVVDYVVSLQAVLPPEDLTGFHNDFIVYLSAAVASPTDLLALPRPLPPDDIRERLSDIEEDVEECRDARFFHVRPEDES